MPNRPHIETLTWDQVRPDILKLRPDFISVLDDYKIDSSYRFYKVRYPFGTHILEEGVFYLPNEEGKMLPLEAFPEPMRTDLAYNAPGHPSGIILEKALEQYIMLNERIIPFYVLEPGFLIGIASLLDRLSANAQGFYNAFSMWEITAGARSVFLLSRISDSQSYKSLQKKYALQTMQPEHSNDHWHLFRELAEKESSPWAAEVIFFPEKLMVELQSKAFAPLLVFLQVENRRPFTFWRNQFSWQATLSHIERLKHLKYSVHLLDTVKHLLAMALGALPACQPSTTEHCVPLSLLQKIFVEEYKIDYQPTIIEPAHFKGLDPVYYSLNYPTSVEYSAKSSLTSTNIADLDQLHIILDKFLKALSQGELNFTHSLLQRIAMETRFNFYHSHNENYSDILSIDDLLQSDPRFTMQQSLNQLEFPKNSTFFKGCIGMNKA